MFEKERFIEDCRVALKEGDTHASIRELVATAVSEPVHVLRALGEPQRASVETIYRADDLTILNLCWGSCTRKTRPRWAQRLFMLLRTHWIRLRRRSTFTAEISLPRLAANGIPRRLKSAPMTWRIPCELLKWRTNDFAERCVLIAQAPGA
jgi:hypothetical protein